MSATFVFVTLLAIFAETQAKIFPVYHQDHFHDYLQDLPVGSRFASVIAFYNDSRQCESALKKLSWNEDDLPSTEHLLLAQFEMSTARERVWYEWREHLDLAKHLGVTDYPKQCPILVFIPSSYADEVGDDYLTNPSTEHIQIWNKKPVADPPTLEWVQSVVFSDGTTESAVDEKLDWKTWVWQNMMQIVRISVDIPFDFQITVMHQTQNSYLKVIEKPWSETIKIDAIQSFTELQVFPGDTIQITIDPKVNREMKRRKFGEALEPQTNSKNPSYTVHAAMDILNVIEFEDGTWGFDDDRMDMIDARFAKKRHQITLMTHSRNLILPLVLPATHPLGYIKTMMPEGLHERMVRYYRKWYHERKEETWDPHGTQLNFFKVKTHMISLDIEHQERDRIAHDVMKPVLLNWAHSNGWTNITDLKFNAFYGIREYSRGASLRNHVDRVDTHVFSAILQIAQSGVEDPWPLQVIGFDGKLVDITLEPGEMILYEGHKLIHGRPYPFNGTRFTNAFIHFSPEGWDWKTSMIWKHEKARKIFREYHVADMHGIWAE